MAKVLQMNIVYDIIIKIIIIFIQFSQAMPFSANHNKIQITGDYYEKTD